MRIKTLITEDFVNYKKPNLFLSIGDCDFKCCKEADIDISICQNSQLANSKEIEYSYKDIYNSYINNSITQAVVIGGMEPMTRFDEIIELIKYFRINGCYDPFIIYTGYYPYEINKQIKILKQYKSIIMKFGRYIPNNKPHYDDILGIELISDNQYGEVISFENTDESR